METIWRIPLVALIVISLSGQVQGQYFSIDGAAFVTMTCNYATSNRLDYDSMEIWRSAKTVSTFDEAASTKIADQTRADQEGAMAPNTYGDDAARYGTFSFDYVNLTPTLRITEVVYSDDGRYWCVFKDTEGGTNQPIVHVSTDLTILNQGTITLKNLLDQTVTGELTESDTAADSNVVASFSVTFQCKVVDSNPASTIVWKINGAVVNDGDNGISIPPTAVSEGSEPPLMDYTSDMTFTPFLNDASGVAAFDDNEVQCEASRSWNSDTQTSLFLSKQALNVLVRPERVLMTFDYDGATHNHGDTVDIVRGQTITIQADVKGSRDMTDITFDDSNIITLTDATTGTEEDNFNAADGRLFDSTNTFTFKAEPDNNGDYLEFSASNDAVDLAGTPAPVARLNFNLLAGPESVITYIDPVTDTAADPISGEESECDQEITIIAGEALTITCKSEITDPAAVVKIYQGDGGTIDAGDTPLAESTDADVVANGALWDTTLIHTITNPQFADDGQVISCMSTNTIDGVVNTDIASACLAFVVQPGLESLGLGSSGGDEDPNLGGAPDAFGETLTATETLADGESVTYTVSADNASPAVTVKWYFTTAGGTRSEITSDPTPSTVDTPDADGLIDTVSTLTISFSFSDCGAKIECVISHPESGVDPVVTYEVTLQILSPPPTDTLPQISMSAPATDDYEQTNDKEVASVVELVDGTDYTFTCTSEAADEAPDIHLNLRQNDDPSGDVTLDIATNIIGDTPDCTLSSNNGEVTITADFDTHHNYRLQCVTTNTAGSADAHILLTVQVAPDGIQMYVGGVDTGVTPNVPSGALATGISTADMGDDLIFTCVATNANPAALVDWTLVGRGSMADTEIEELDDGDRLYDTLSTLDTTPYAASDCGMALTCTTNHAATSNTPQFTFTTTLMVRVPPTGVDLWLLDAGSDVAATSSPTALTADTSLTSSDTLVVINGLTYVFEARTENQVDPKADFDWDRRSSLNAVEEDLDDEDEPDTITCSQDVDKHQYTLENVDHDTYNGKRLYVAADNDHVDQGPVSEYVNLDVYAEVNAGADSAVVKRQADGPAKMEMIVKRMDNDAVVDVANGEPLVDGADYYVDCIIREATPAPTNIDLDLGADEIGDTTQDPDGTDVSTGSLASYVTTGRDSFTASYADHCDKDLKCTASNDANIMLDNVADQEIFMTVKVITPPETVTVEWTSGTGGSFSDATAIVIDTTNDNEFQCTVDGADEAADVTLIRLTTSDAEVSVDSWDGTETEPDCNTEQFQETSSLFPQVNYLEHHGTKVKCCAENSIPDSKECDEITLEVHTPPSDLKIYVGETEYNDGETVSIQAGMTDFKCEALNSNPAVSITWEFSAVDGDPTTDTPSGTDDEGAPDSDGLIDFTNDVEDYDIQECFTVICTATNDAITELGLQDDFKRTLNVRPLTPPETVTVEWTSGTGGSFSDTTAIVIDTTNDNEFQCTVDGAEEAADVTLIRLTTSDSEVSVDSWDGTETEPDCNTQQFQKTSSLFPQVNYLEHHGTKVKCCAENSIPDSKECDEITLEVHTPPSDLKIYVGETEYNNGDTVYIQAGMTDFKCEALNSNPAVSITWEFSAVDGDPATDTPSGTDDEGAPDSDGLIDFTNDVEEYDIQECFTVICTATNDAITELGLQDDFKRTVNVRPSIGPGEPKLVLDSGDEDGTTTEPNEHAILIEGNSYDFTCTVEANMADPDSHIRWELHKGDDELVHFQDDDSGEEQADCSLDEVTKTYELTADKVTFEDLQCGYLECIAYHGDDPTTGMKKTMTFQIWKLPPESPVNGGGDGIKLEYREFGSGDEFSDITHDDDLELDVGIEYEFQCTVLGINPVSGLAAAGGSAPDVCSGGTGPTSSIEQDIVNINFYYESEALDNGESNDDDPEPAMVNGDLYDVSDTYKRTITAGDSCPADLICRVTVDRGSGLSASPSDTPFITVHITRISSTTEVEIITPDFSGEIKGELITASSPPTAGSLALYDGDSYELKCAARGADPNTDIIWWVVDDCAVAANDAGNGADQIRDDFVPGETMADCNLQNLPQDNDDDTDTLVFAANLNDHNDKCLRCMSGDGEVDQYELEIRKAPSEIKAFDGDTDDDKDGALGTADELDNPQPVCNGLSFDFTAIAYGANPAVDHAITLEDVTVASDAPYAGIVVGPIIDSVSPLDPNLSDSTVKVTFPAGSLSLADNGHDIEVCDPESNVCTEFELDIVDLPDTPMSLEVTDPFAEKRTPPGLPTDTRALSDEADPIRLHLGEDYTFTCEADNAHPYAELKFALDPPNGPLNYSPTVPSPDPEGAEPDTLFDSTSTLLYTPTTFDSSGSTFCCVAENRATEIECGPVPVDICVVLEIINEPSEVVMEFMTVDSGGAGFEDAASMTVNDVAYTDLKQDDTFDFQCTAKASAPAAEIEWEFKGAGENADFNLVESDGYDGPIVTTPASESSPINGQVDTKSRIQFKATTEVRGGTLKCCAKHVAIPDGDEVEVYQDPGLEVLCDETVLRFPVAPSHLEIWSQPEGGGSPVYYTDEENEEQTETKDIQQFKANVGEEFTLYCTSYEARPEAYITWSEVDDDEVSDPLRDSTAISSDCPKTSEISDSNMNDPLLITYDTTKCVRLTPDESDHLQHLYCTAINTANLVGALTREAVQLYLCIPCKQNLKLVDVTDGGNLAQSDSYDEGATVVFQRNGQERTISCVNEGAREKPVIDIYIKPAGEETPIKLTECEEGCPIKKTEEKDLGDKMWFVRKDATLAVGAHDFIIDGATLICECRNSVVNGESDFTIEVKLTAFDEPAVSERVYLGLGTQANFDDKDGGRVEAEFPTITLDNRSPVASDATDPYSPPNFPAAKNHIQHLLDNRRKRQADEEPAEFTCYALGTKPAVDFIWKLDDHVLSGDFINTYVVDSELNQGIGQGLLDTYSTLTWDPIYRGLHSRELCCEVSSSIIGSPIKRCAILVVQGPPNSPLEVSGTNVVNEGQTVQLQCTATEQFPAGTFQWDDDDGNTLLSDEAQTQSQLRLLSDFRFEQDSEYSFTATREDNGKNLVCKFEQHHEENGNTFDATTTGEIEISVNFCPSTNAQMSGCPNAPVAPERAVTVSCETAVSNPALRLDWYLNNVAQSPSGASTTQARDYGYVTVQTFTTRQLGLADDGLQLQCCPTHPTTNIGCGQLCSSVCTVRVEQPPPDAGCRYVRMELTLENIDGDDASWHADYENNLSAAYRNLVNGATDVIRQVFDGLPDYRSAIVPTLKESADGHVQVIVGLQFDSPYTSTTDHIKQALQDATNSEGHLVLDNNDVSIYDILPNSVTAVCVCPSGFCTRGPECTPSVDDYSSSCDCPANYAPPRCDVYVPPGTGTQPPSVVGVLYARLAFILDEINDVPAIWNSDYDDLTDAETQDLINGLDTVLSSIFSPAFSACFRNVRIADLFQATGGGIGVVAGIDFSHDCGVTVTDIREKFLENIDNDQKIANSIYELDGDFLSETNVEEVCGSDFSCSNGGYCVPSDTLYYNTCECPPGYGGSRCQDIIRVVTTPDPRQPTRNPDPGDGLTTEALIGIIIGVVLFAAILIGLLLLCCFLCGDKERVHTRYVYSDEDEPPQRAYGTPPRNGYGSQPQRGAGRGLPYDDWPWASDGRPPVAYNKDTFDFESRQGARMGPRPVF